MLDSNSSDAFRQAGEKIHMVKIQVITNRIQKTKPKTLSYMMANPLAMQPIWSNKQLVDKLAADPSLLDASETDPESKISQLIAENQQPSNGEYGSSNLNQYESTSKNRHDSSSMNKYGSAPPNSQITTQSSCCTII